MSPSLELTIEALIFASDAPLAKATLLDALARPEFADLPRDEAALDEALAQLEQKYADDAAFAFSLRQVAGGYQFYTKAGYAAAVQALHAHIERKKLSRAALETLAIIAYKQPATRSEVEFVRGVSSEYAIHKLLDKNLIEAAGQADLPGRPTLFRTTDYFMSYFGLSSLDDLPRIPELTAHERQLAAAQAEQPTEQPVSE